MKANEAPEKLYLISDEDGVMLSYDPSTKLQYGHRYDFVDEEVFPIEKGCDVEYIRTDAFIEKALAYLNSKFYFHNAFYGVVSTDFNAMEELFEDFRKYMEESKV